MALLVDYVPFSERHQLRSLLASAADTVLYGLGKFAHSTFEGPLVQLSLALLASVCLHSSAEDIYLIPQVVWHNNQIQILQIDVNRFFRFSRSHDYISYLSISFKEPEEVEMELDLLEKEQAVQESSNDRKEWCQLPFLDTYAKDDDCLQQIKDSIQHLDDTIIEFLEPVAGKRSYLYDVPVKNIWKKQLCEKQNFFKHLIEITNALLCVRERTTEVEREIERQQSLELERAKTNELCHHLDMKKEKQSQARPEDHKLTLNFRELQRELEQVESGVRPSRREFSTSTHNRYENALHHTTNVEDSSLEAKELDGQVNLKT
ncbi:hypothetical protein ACSBR2_016773 [Camellia fascicularis]